MATVRKTARRSANSKSSKSVRRNGAATDTISQVGLPFTEVLRLHTEIPRNLKNLLDRISLERKQQGNTPFTQGDIVEDALWDWLIKHDHAKKRDR